MKTLTGALGTTFIACWERTPAFVRFPIVGLVVVFALSETNIDLQHSLQAARIFGGQAADADAKSDDANRARADLKAGLPISGAAALVATQINQGDATAKNTYATVPQTQAISDAATESVDEIEDKLRRGAFVNSTEQLRLLEYRTKLVEFQTKEAERDKTRADVHSAEARASSADAEAQASIASNNLATNYIIPNTPHMMGQATAPMDLQSLLLAGRRAGR